MTISKRQDYIVSVKTYYNKAEKIFKKMLFRNIPLHPGVWQTSGVQ